MDLAVKGTYSFNVYPSTVMGTNFQNVTVLALLDSDLAQQLGFDVYGMHALVSPTLPTTTQITDPTKYTYVQILLPSGLKQIIAYEWINANTIQTVNLGKFTVTLDNRASTDQQNIINILAANGIAVSTIDFTAATST